MLRLPVVEMAAEPAPPPVAAGYEPHPVGTGERIRRPERVNAELVEASRSDVDRCRCGYPMPCSKTVPIGFCRAPLTSATKEQQK